MVRRTTDSQKWGGKRPASGRNKRNIHLTSESARELAVLTKQRQSSEEQIVKEMIRAAWLELDRDYQQAQ